MCTSANKFVGTCYMPWKISTDNIACVQCRSEKACFWWHVFLQPCRRWDFCCHRTWWGGVGGVGWGGLITSMYACGTTSCYVDVTFLHACTNTKVAGTQQIDPCWNHLKKFAPVRWRTALTQPSMLDSGIESISGSIATTCLSEIWRPHARWKERLLKLFVIWCRNWSLKKWQNVRRFGTWMSKTHGCANPCYHVFTPPHPHPHHLPSPTQPCTHAAWSAAMGTGWRPDWMETWQGLRGVVPYTSSTGFLQGGTWTKHVLLR